MTKTEEGRTPDCSWLGKERGSCFFFLVLEWFFSCFSFQAAQKQKYKLRYFFPVG